MTAAEYLIQHHHDAAERALKAAQEDTVITRVLSSLPPDLAIERISVNGYCAKATLTLPAIESMEDETFARIRELLPAEPLARVKDGSLTFKPLADVTNIERGRGDVTDVRPVILRHDVAPFYPPYGEKRELCWWTLVDGLPVAVTVPLLDPTASTVTINTSGFGRTKTHQSTIAACPGAHVDKYWSAEPAEHASVVFWWPFWLTQEPS